MNIGRVADALLRGELMNQRKESSCACQAEAVQEEEDRLHSKCAKVQRRSKNLELQ